MNLRNLFTSAAAVAVIALWACTSVASATEVTTDGDETYSGTIEAANENGHMVLAGSSGVKSECSSTLAGSVASQGEEVPAEVKLSSLTFSSCTNGYVVHVPEPGSLIIHATSGGNGTLTSNGAKIEVTAKTFFGTITCIYTTSNTTIGTFTGSWGTVGEATLDISATIPRTGGSGLCGTTGSWTGSYLVSNPSTLAVESADMPDFEVKVKAGDPRKYAENEVKEFTIQDTIGKVNWQLEKVTVGVESGAWGVEGAESCQEVSVTAGQGFVCKVKVKCITKGSARLQIEFSWGKPKQLLTEFSRLKCL